MEDLRKAFPALAGQTYLNTAATGLLSAPLAAYRTSVDTAFLQNGNNVAFQEQTVNQTRESIARFFGATTGETALVPNFSMGINILLDGLPKKQKILLLKNDYPSVNWPVETRDFEVYHVEVNSALEKNIEVAISRHKPDIFIFSVVQWLTGIKIDLQFLRQLKAYHPQLLLIADGTQYLGTEAFAFHDSPFDIIGASGYKWLLSGQGNGFFLVKDEIKHRIKLTAIGFNSADSFQSTASETRFIKHFEPGHLPALLVGSLGKSLQLFEDWGVEKLYGQVAALSHYAFERLTEKGLLPQAYAQRPLHSPIFNIRGTAADYRKLKEDSISTSQRGGGIRVSFHFYNTEDDIERLLSHF